MSIKESARIAQSNNFMGLICRSSLLVCFLLLPSPLFYFYEATQLTKKNVVPALVETIKEQGLVLVADTSDDAGQSAQRHQEEVAAANPMGVAEWAYRMPDGVNGVMKANGILRFNDTIDM